MKVTTAELRQFVSSKGFAVVVASAVSATAGYILAREQLKVKMAEVIDNEIAETKTYYAQLHKTGDFEDPGKLVEKYETEQPPVQKNSAVMEYAAEKLAEYETQTTDYKSVSDEPEVIDPVKEANALNQMYEEEGLNGTPFDMEAELATRDTNHPYIISFEEWIADDFQHEQISITYYEADDVLADDADRPIPDVDANIGDRCLSQFGYGSKDPMVVYVRNESRGMDYEVLLNKNSYESEVLGIQHSRYREKTPRFRHGDDG